MYIWQKSIHICSLGRLSLVPSLPVGTPDGILKCCMQVRVEMDYIKKKKRKRTRIIQTFSSSVLGP